LELLKESKALVEDLNKISDDYDIEKVKNAYINKNKVSDDDFTDYFYGRKQTLINNIRRISLVKYPKD
jgi:hypothetical protein